MSWPTGYTLVPLLFGSGLETKVWALSADGLTAVGQANDFDGATHAVYWQSSGAAQDLGFLPGGTYSIAQGVNHDGSVIVGFGDNTDGDRAWMWTAGGGMLALPIPVGSTYSYAYGISSDGSTIVGEYGDPDTGNDVACYWAGSDPVDIGRLPGGDAAWTNAASRDRTGLVGTSHTADGPPAFRWTSDGGMEDLGVLEVDSQSFSYAVSGDGSIVVGAGYVSDVPGPGAHYHAFRWTTGTGMVDLSTLSTSGSAESFANNISNDGSTIIGQSNTDSSPGVMFPLPWWYLWTQADGMQEQNSVHNADMFWATGAYGWGISADASVCAGHATFPQTNLTFGSSSVYWTLSDGHLHYLETPVTAGSYAQAYDVSNDGSIIAGYVYDAAVSQFEPAMWTNGVLTVLPQPGSEPGYTTFVYAVSGDGSTVIGLANGKATYWTSSDGFSVAHVLPVLPGDDAPTGGRIQLPLTSGNIGAKLSSTDGSKIIGNSLHNNSPSPSTATGVVWTNGTITTSLPNSNNPGGVFLQSCSSDGISLIAGWTFDGSTDVPCIWLNGTTQHDLNALPNTVVSCDESGSVVCLSGGIYFDSLSTNHGGTPNRYGNGAVRGVAPGYGPGLNVSCFAPENNLVAGGGADDGTGHNGAVRWNGTAGDALGVVGATTRQGRS